MNGRRCHETQFALFFCIFFGMGAKAHMASLAKPAFGTHKPEDTLPAPPESAPRKRIKVYYLNSHSNTSSSNARDLCMHHQLKEVRLQAASLGLDIAFESWPMVQFRHCWDAASCLAEHPQCFPDACVSYTSFLDKGKVRFQLGLWCSIYRLLKASTEENEKYDYVMVMRDDVAILGNFALRMSQFLREFPEHWTSVALDATSTAFPPQDAWPNTTSKGLPLFSMSGTRGTYQGVRAFIMHGSRMKRFLRFYESVPAVPTDLLSKVPRPMHLGMWAFQPGAIRARMSMEPQELQSLGYGCDAAQLPDTPQAPPRTSDEIQTTSKSLLLRQTGTTSPREMVLFGMYDSGTKMLSEMIRHNLEEPNGVRVCKNYTMWGYCGRVWKHTNPHRIMELETLRNCSRCSKLGNLKDAVAVVMVRHPFSLVRSLQRHSYDMQCGGKLDRPCYYPEPAMSWLERTQAGMPRLKSAPCDKQMELGDECWKSLPDAWNNYVSGYRQLNRVFHKTVILRYEDVVEDPESAMRRIASAVDLPMPKDVVAVKRALGKPGQGFADKGSALDKLATLDYASNYSCSELEALCKRIDRGLLFQLGYHGCQHFWPAWGEMIFHGFTYAKDMGKMMALRALPEVPRCAPDLQAAPWM